MLSLNPLYLVADEQLHECSCPREMSSLISLSFRPFQPALSFLNGLQQANPAQATLLQPEKRNPTLPMAKQQTKGYDDQNPCPARYPQALYP